MMRTIRLRVFLTVWPLVVLALVAIGLQFGRWMVVEVNRLESSASREPAPDHAARARRLAAGWSEAPAAAARMQSELRNAGNAGRILVTDTSGQVVANPAGLRGEDLRRAGPGELELAIRVREGGRVRLDVLRFRGTPIATVPGTPLGYLYMIGAPRAADTAAADRTGDPSALRTLAGSATRRIWMAIAIASIVAALVTLLVANPLVAQVHRLSAAAGRVRGGALHTRVAVSSRDELGTLEQAFNEMAGALEASEAAKRRMISDASHELRTPLTNVIGLLDAMRDGVRPADAATLDSAHEEALLLGTLVEELQEMSMLDAGVMRFDIEPLDAIEEARRAIDACRTAVGPSMLLRASTAPQWVLADRRRLAQVLRNLLRNAIAHTDADREVAIEVQRGGDGVVSIAVVDQGDGIPAEELPLVWERFHRVDPSRARSTGGMGLGLAVVRQLVIAMGGRVEAESAVGQGSRFTVLLPAAAELGRRDVQILR